MAGIVFQRLPVELIIKILCESDGRSIICTASTCGALHAIIRDSLELQYRIELFASGLQDPSPKSKLELTAKFSEVKTLTQNWAYLQFRESEPHNFLSDDAQLIGHVFSYSIYNDYIITSIEFFKHRSIAYTGKAMQWTVSLSGMNIDHYIYDPSQNLIAASVHDPAQQPGTPSLEHEIRLITMDTAVPHPKAERDILRCIHGHSTSGSYIYCMRIYQDYLGMLCSKSELFIWNWKTGNLVADCRCLSSESDSIMRSFSFISPSHFVVSSVSTIESDESPYTLMVYNFHPSPANELQNPKLVRLFQLPMPASGVRMNFMQIKPETSASDSFQASRPSGSDPLYRLLTVTFQLRTIDEYLPKRCIRVYNLFMEQSTLLDVTFQTGLVVPWDVWGPSRTRLIQSLVSSSSCGTAAGMRFASLKRRDHTLRLCVRDFHPVRFRKGSGDSTSLSELPWSIENFPPSVPTIIHERRLWHNDISTTLPYRQVVSRMIYKSEDTDIYINEECVMGNSLYPGADGGRSPDKLGILYV